MTTNSIVRIGLASVRNALSIEERLRTVDRTLEDAVAQKVAIVCFPGAYIPGLRGMDFPVPDHDQHVQREALEHMRRVARQHRVAVIIGMEWQTRLGLHNLAFVIDRNGEVRGHQAKNQIPPVEDQFYGPDGDRRVFEVDGLTFGITICHEGWRYPESVRWSARHGAQIVFHPQLTGSDVAGPTLRRWGDPDAPYYEKAMIGRAVENEIWFASVNNAFAFQESATSIIAPDGRCAAYVPYGEEQLLVYDIDLSTATRQYARRFEPSFYAPR